MENQYRRAVRREGNLPAQALMRRVFEVVPRKWRGIGEIPHSGLGLAPAYAAFDAEQQIRRGGPARGGTARMPERPGAAGPDQTARMSGVRRGCTPEHPLGATMVSSEGACAAYYRYRRRPADFHDMNELNFNLTCPVPTHAISARPAGARRRRAS